MQKVFPLRREYLDFLGHLNDLDAMFYAMAWLGVVKPALW